MVDNILKDSEEVGHGSDGEDPDLSGDEVKTPIFVIKRDQEESKESTQMAEYDQQVVDNEDYEEEEEDQLFVQEEYDLANNLD